MYKLGIKINQADHYNAMHFIRVRWDCVLHISRYKKKKMRDFCSDLNWWKSVSHQLISNLLLLSSFFNTWLQKIIGWIRKIPHFLIAGVSLEKNCIIAYPIEWTNNDSQMKIFRIHLTIKMTFHGIRSTISILYQQFSITNWKI